MITVRHSPSLDMSVKHVCIPTTSVPVWVKHSVYPKEGCNHNQETSGWHARG